MQKLKVMKNNFDYGAYAVLMSDSGGLYMISSGITFNWQHSLEKKERNLSLSVILLSGFPCSPEF